MMSLKSRVDPSITSPTGWLSLTCHLTPSRFTITNTSQQTMLLERSWHTLNHYRRTQATLYKGSYPTPALVLFATPLCDSTEHLEPDGVALCPIDRATEDRVVAYMDQLAVYRKAEEASGGVWNQTEARTWRASWGDSVMSEHPDLSTFNTLSVVAGIGIVALITITSSFTTYITPALGVGALVHGVVLLRLAYAVRLGHIEWSEDRGWLDIFVASLNWMVIYLVAMLFLSLLVI